MCETVLAALCWKMPRAVSSPRIPSELNGFHMYQQEKIKQHYVSWFYLKNWVNESAKHQKGIWARSGADAPFFAKGRDKLARIDRFYRVSVDQVVLEMMRYQYPFAHAQGYLRDLLQELAAMTDITEFISHKAPFHGRLENINTNFLENKYGELEGYISRDLDKLLKGRWLRILRTPSTISSLYDSLLCLYATQLCRTRDMRDLMSQQIKSPAFRHDGGETVLSSTQKDTLFKLVLYVESMRLCEQLRRARPLIGIYYQSEGNASFHTSNAPAQSLWHKVDSQKQFLEYHGEMPVSPTHFMIIRKDRQTSAKIMRLPASERQIDHINQTFVRRNRGSELYAVNRESLLDPPARSNI
jgi:hypothetical protein